jgi:hypothetical protein
MRPAATPMRFERWFTVERGRGNYVRVAAVLCRLSQDSVAGLFDALEQHPRADFLLLDLNLQGAQNL